jgi:hypothetical protein
MPSFSRPRRSSMKAAVLALAALVATGCMGRSPSSGSGKAQPVIPAKTYLRIAVFPNGKGHPQRYQLWCRGPGGELSSGIAKPISAPRACERLVRLWPEGSAPVPKDVACTEVYGGPQVAEVSGMFHGKPVSARFTRTDGCEIARWNRVRFLFPGVR